MTVSTKDVVQMIESLVRQNKSNCVVGMLNRLYNRKEISTDVYNSFMSEYHTIVESTEVRRYR